MDLDKINIKLALDIQEEEKLIIKCFSLVKVASSIILLSLSSFSFGTESQYEEGKHYLRLSTPIQTENPEKIEITEYFSYGCPHCFRFEGLISQWRTELESDIVFNRSPAIWNVPGYKLYARTYYTLESLGVLSELHLRVFRAIHNNGRRLDTIEKMTAFVSEHDVDPEKFLRTYNDSFGVKAKYQRALARQKIYASRGVPALIVNGKYRIESSMVGNSNLGMLQVADFLIAKEKNLQSIRE